MNLIRKNGAVRAALSSETAVEIPIDTNAADFRKQEQSRCFPWNTSRHRSSVGMLAQGESQLDNFQQVSRFAWSVAGADRDAYDLEFEVVELWAQIELPVADWLGPP